MNCKGTIKNLVYLIKKERDKIEQALSIVKSINQKITVADANKIPMSADDYDSMGTGKDLRDFEYSLSQQNLSMLNYNWIILFL